LLRRGGASIATLDRRPLSRRVILGVLPRAVECRFDPASAGDLTAELELRVREPGRTAPARFAIAIAEGRCRVRAGAARSPGAAVELSAGDMIRLASGAGDWPQMLSSGRLELSGDPFLALRFPSLFRISLGAD
jgi:hypothetical protein